MKITLWRSRFLPRSAVLGRWWSKPEAKIGQRNQEAKVSVIAADLQTGCEWMTS